MTQSLEAPPACSQEGCTAPQGSCLEGFDEYSDCPHYAIDSGSGESSASRDIPLHSGDALTTAEATSLMRRSPTRLVVLAGAANVGKTTLLSVLYEKFLRGAFGRFVFAGSLTLEGFEERCYLSRLASWRPTPDTKRTQRGTASMFLHLRLANNDRSFRPADLLFTDIAGEEFDAIRDVPNEAVAADIVRRSDHFAVALDSTELMENSVRHAIRASTIQLLRSGIEAGLLRDASGIQLVATKWDTVEDSRRDDVMEFLNRIHSEIADMVEIDKSRTTSHVTACRSRDDGGVTEGHGLKDLLCSWMGPPLERMTMDTADPDPQLMRPYDTFRARG